MYTHKRCYIDFAFCYERTEKVDEEAEILAIDTFFFKIRQKILREKCAFVLTDLYDDLVSICEELRLEEPVITNNRTLRPRLEEHFDRPLDYQLEKRSQTKKHFRIPLPAYRCQ